MDLHIFAPKGGFNIGDVFYQAGQLIPHEVFHAAPVHVQNALRLAGGVKHIKTPATQPGLFGDSYLTSQDFDKVQSKPPKPKEQPQEKQKVLFDDMSWHKDQKSLFSVEDSLKESGAAISEMSPAPSPKDDTQWHPSVEDHAPHIAGMAARFAKNLNRVGSEDEFSHEAKKAVHLHARKTGQDVDPKLAKVIIKRAMVDHARTLRGRSQKVTTMSPMADFSADDETDIGNRATSKPTDHFEDHIEHLDDDHKNLLRLVYKGGHTVKEAADKAGIPYPQALAMRTKAFSLIKSRSKDKSLFSVSPDMRYGILSGVGNFVGKGIEKAGGAVARLGQSMQSPGNFQDAYSNPTG